MGKSIIIERVRSTFVSAGHTPLFLDGDYDGIATKLRFSCGSCGKEAYASYLSMRNNQTGRCALCQHEAKTKNYLHTRDGKFSYVEASSKYGIKRGSLASRKRAGWSDDQACGLESPPVGRRNKEALAFVYGWHSKVHGRIVYVGLTVQGIKARSQAHIRSALYGSKTKFAEILRSTGAQNFEVVELWSGPLSDVGAVEKEMIHKYKTSISEGGFNMSPGGGLGANIGKIVSYKGKEYDSLASLWREVGGNVDHKTFEQRVRRGMDIESALLSEKITDRAGLRKKVIVRGTEYGTVKEAWSAEANGIISLGCFHKRLLSGETPEQALSRKSTRGK
jgi:hypothetical protein